MDSGVAGQPPPPSHIPLDDLYLIVSLRRRSGVLPCAPPPPPTPLTRPAVVTILIQIRKAELELWPQDINIGFSYILVAFHQSHLFSTTPSN